MSKRDGIEQSMLSIDMPAATTIQHIIAEVSVSINWWFSLSGPAKQEGLNYHTCQTPLGLVA